MKDFQVALTFLALSEHSAPRATNLLFYNQHENRTARGYYTEATGTLMLIGAQWLPTHFAIYEELVEQQSGRLRTFGVSNEAGDYFEIQANNHKDAVTRFRQQDGIVGPAKLRTTDTEAVLGRRMGQHHMDHNTRSFIQPTIFWRNSFDGGDGWRWGTRRVTISATCPTCGQPRGPLVYGRVCEDGEFFNVNNWTNACGHQDSYKDAWQEYLQLKKDGVLNADGLPIAGEVLTEEAS